MSDFSIWLCCGVLRAEMELLHREEKIGGTLLFLDSMLHVDPLKLECRLNKAIESVEPSNRIVLVYGDCCPRMRELMQRHSLSRVHAINCAEMLLGPARYHALMREQTFFLLPEWTVRWREVFEENLGLTPSIAPDFMRDYGRQLIYIDTGIVPVPNQALEECSAYTGLPWRIEPVTLDTLLSLLLEAEKALPLLASY